MSLVVGYEFIKFKECMHVPFTSLPHPGAFLSVAMSPQDVKVNAGEWAMFTCSMSCNLTLTNTMNWFVGDSPSNKRRVDQNFQYRTGIMIKEIDISDCRGSEMERRELYIFASSVEKMNSTAVQCGATRKHPNIPDLYSHYGIIIVEGTYVYYALYVIMVNQEEVGHDF